MHCPHCGCEIEKSKRSHPQLGRYFARLKAMFHHWPDTHDRQFSNENEFRAWIQMKAGYRDIVLDMPMSGIKGEVAAMIATTVLRSAGSYAVAAAVKGRLVVLKPRSIAFHKMGPKEFSRLVDDVDAAYRNETGLDPDDVTRQTETAA